MKSCCFSRRSQLLTDLFDDKDSCWKLSFQSVLSVLPPATKAEVLKIGTDASLSPEVCVVLLECSYTLLIRKAYTKHRLWIYNLQQKLERLHAVISALPQAVRDKIPIPPSLKKLPQPIQSKIVTIVKNGGLTLAQKRAQLDAVYNSLTPQQKALVPLWTELRK